MLRPKPGIERLVPATHGGIDYAELGRLGIRAGDVLDFSVSTNPFGPPPGIQEAICKVQVDRYPDSESSELKALLAGKLGTSPDNLLVGSGSTELFRLIALAYFSPDDTVLVPQPTYGDYENVCRLVDAGVVKSTVIDAQGGFLMNAGSLISEIRRTCPRGVFLCNPNNPTGQYFAAADVKAILTEVKDGMVVLDEAYIAFTENAWPSLDLINSGNLVVVRSMTKDYGLAGLRLGYAVASPEIISTLKLVRPPWHVSAVAQAAGVFALNSRGYLETCARKIQEAKQFLIDELKNLGFEPLSSQANFFLVKVSSAVTLREALLRKGILVRDCTSFGMPDYIRLAPRSIPECRKLLAAINSARSDTDAG